MSPTLYFKTCLQIGKWTDRRLILGTRQSPCPAVLRAPCPGGLLFSCLFSPAIWKQNIWWDCFCPYWCSFPSQGNPLQRSAQASSICNQMTSSRQRFSMISFDVINDGAVIDIKLQEHKIPPSAAHVSWSFPVLCWITIDKLLFYSKLIGLDFCIYSASMFKSLRSSQGVDSKLT